MRRSLCVDIPMDLIPTIRRRDFAYATGAKPVGYCRFQNQRGTCHDRI